MSPEIAFVVAMDIVGFSPLSMERKAQITRELTDSVHGSTAYQEAAMRGQVIPLDSGDGAALVFFGDPLVAIRAAVEIHERINCPSCPSPLRIGVHVGPVMRRTDAAGKPNVSGHGIDLAFRVMAVGDGSAVTVSESYAAMLRPFALWSARLSPPVEHTVKHAQKIQVCQLQTAAPSEPEAAPIPAVTVAAQPKAAVEVGEAGLRVAIVYKRHTEPDGALLADLERRLAGSGYSVFIDRHMSIGVEWAQEIERQLRAADAVIALLSDRAGDSEMMLYELQQACDERERRGKPVILPVRIGSDAALGGEIGQLVSRYHYFHWSGAAESERLWAEIDAALRRPAGARQEPVGSIEQPGGAVPLDSPFYIERPTDAAFLEAIARRDSIVLVKGARQMGKTSVLARGVRTARERGWRVVLTDFQTFSSSQLESDERLYKSLMHAFKSQLKLEVDLAGCWNDWLGPNTNLETFLTDEVLTDGVLPNCDAHLIWVMDEVDRLFNRPYATDFFGMVRSWHNRRALEPDGPWQRFTVSISYATEAHLFITDLNQSPFNVGTRLSLSDFTLEEVRELNGRYGGPLNGEAELRAFYDLLSGQPYLTRRAFDELVQHGHALADVARLADQEEGLFGDHLRRLMVTVSNEATLGAAVRDLLAGKAIPSELFFRLRAGGVIKGDSPANAAFRCRIYETYLRRHLS